MSVNDNMFKSLQDAGFTGALSDMLYQWLETFAPQGVNQFELYNDDHFYCGHFNGEIGGQTYINGISRIDDERFFIRQNGDTAEDRGKYFGVLVNTAWVGSTLEDNPDFELLVFGGNNSSYTHPNMTEQELVDMFGNDGTANRNEYRLTFPDTFPEADLLALRESAGDRIKPLSEIGIGDLWKIALLNLSGLPEETYQYNDYYSAYLTSRGYLGSFSDQLDYFWQDIADGVIDLPSGGTPPATGTITPEELISGITVARGFETIDFTIGSLVPDQWLGETVLSCEIQFIDTGGSTIVIPYLRFTTDTIQPDLGDLTLVIDGTDWFAQYDNQSNAYFFTDGIDPKAYSTALWTFFGNNLGTPLSFELKPTEAVSGTLTIGTLIDPQTGGLFQGFANDPDAGATFGSMNPDTYLGETFIFFGVGQIDQGGGNFIYFPSVRFDGNPDKGDLTATIDGTDFFLKYAAGINAYGFDDGGDQQAYNGTVYTFLEARSGTTVSFDVTLT